MLAKIPWRIFAIKYGFIEISVLAIILAVCIWTEKPPNPNTKATNDNDLIAFKNGMKYTIQTFLNNDITENEINETIEDMKHEHVSYGTIITNKEVSDEIRKVAFNNGIEIIDRKELKKSLSKECCKWKKDFA